MAVTPIDSGIGTATASAVTDFTITLPGDTAEGDVFVVALNIGKSSPAHVVSSQPAESTTVLAPFAPGASTISLSVHCYVAPASPPATITYTLAAAFLGTITWQRFRGVDTAAAVDAAARSTSTALVSSQTAPAITTSVPDCYITGGVGIASSARVVTVPGGWAPDVQSTVGRLGVMSRKGVQSGAGSTGTATWAYDGTATRSVAWQVALAPSTGADFSGSVSLSGAGALTPEAGAVGTSGTLAASGGGVLSIVAAVALAGSLALSGSGALGVTGQPHVTSVAAVAGSGSLTVSGSPHVSGSLATSGAGVLTGTGAPVMVGDLALTGVGALALSGSASTGGASGTLALAGSGTLAASGEAAIAGTLARAGSGSLAIAGTPALLGTVALDGSGALTLTGTNAPPLPDHGDVTLTAPIGTLTLAAPITSLTIAAPHGTLTLASPTGRLEVT